METYTSEEFHGHVFKSSVIEFDKEFLLENINKNCITMTLFLTTPIQWAATCGYLEVVKYLYENGANITSNNSRAVRWAADFGYLEIVKYILGTSLLSKETATMVLNVCDIKNKEILELLQNYTKFSNTKAVR